jgi:hypothetical protein
MTRACASIATCLATAVLATSVLAQTTPQAPPMTSVLAGKHFTPPIKGEATIEITQPKTTRDNKKNEVVTLIKVKNVSNAPIARLTVAETWFGKDQQMVTGGKGFINGLLQPNEITTIEIRTPYDPKMNSNSWVFTHANGSVKPHKVPSLDDPKNAKDTTKKEPAAKPAVAKKK